MFALRPTSAAAAFHETPLWVRCTFVLSMLTTTRGAGFAAWSRAWRSHTIQTSSIVFVAAVLPDIYGKMILCRLLIAQVTFPGVIFTLTAI